MPIAPTGGRGHSDLFGHSRLDRDVRHVMRPGVISLPGHASLREVVRTLASHGVHAVLVHDTSGKALGWVTASGLLEHASRDVEFVSAASAVSEPAVTISPSAPASKAIEALVRSDATRLLVCRGADSAPEGVVTDLDLVRLLAGPVS